MKKMKNIIEMSLKNSGLLNLSKERNLSKKTGKTNKRKKKSSIAQ
jgi:hypothetical protein